MKPCSKQQQEDILLTNSPMKSTVKSILSKYKLSSVWKSMMTSTSSTSNNTISSKMSLRKASTKGLEKKLSGQMVIIEDDMMHSRPNKTKPYKDVPTTIKCRGAFDEDALAAASETGDDDDDDSSEKEDEYYDWENSHSNAAVSSAPSVPVTCCYLNSVDADTIPANQAWEDVKERISTIRDVEEARKRLHVILSQAQRNLYHKTKLLSLRVGRSAGDDDADASTSSNSGLNTPAFAVQAMREVLQLEAQRDRCIKALLALDCLLLEIKNTYVAVGSKVNFGHHLRFILSQPAPRHGLDSFSDMHMEAKTRVAASTLLAASGSSSRSSLSSAAAGVSPSMAQTTSLEAEKRAFVQQLMNNMKQTSTSLQIEPEIIGKMGAGGSSRDDTQRTISMTSAGLFEDEDSFSAAAEEEQQQRLGRNPSLPCLLEV